MIVIVGSDAMAYCTDNIAQIHFRLKRLDGRTNSDEVRGGHPLGGRVAMI